MSNLTRLAVDLGPSKAIPQADSEVGQHWAQARINDYIVEVDVGWVSEAGASDLVE